MFLLNILNIVQQIFDFKSNIIPRNTLIQLFRI